jgi:hypothetical protein
MDEQAKQPKRGKQELERQLWEIINSRRAKPTQQYQWAVNQLIKIKGWDGRPKQKLKHVRSKGGAIQETLRKEARAKREALAAFEESNHGTQQ